MAGTMPRRLEIVCIVILVATAVSLIVDWIG